MLQDEMKSNKMLKLKPDEAKNKLIKTREKKQRRNARNRKQLQSL